MDGRFLVGSHQGLTEPNIYADKSSLVLEWLLLQGIEKDQFSIREVARDKGISVGLVQKVFGSLVLHGYLQVAGLRTAKTFIFKKPETLLRSWLENYSIVKKCKMRTYRTALSGREQLLQALQTCKKHNKVVLALHSAAKALGYQNTNLQTLELYLAEPGIRLDIEKVLELEPQEKGYEVLLIEPYYKSMLGSDGLPQKPDKQKNPSIFLRHTSTLLTFLDLYHFPLRGREQAEFMVQRVIELKHIFRKGV